MQVFPISLSYPPVGLTKQLLLILQRACQHLLKQFYLFENNYLELSWEKSTRAASIISGSLQPDPVVKNNQLARLSIVVK